MQFAPGTMIAGRYRIASILGSGGMGEVYRADDVKLGQIVALKFLPARLNRDAVLLGRLHDEVRLGRQVAHPNVCHLYLALEPLARRRWPEQLIAWSRLIGGRPRDPLVGRHVLIGLIVGMLHAAIAGSSQLIASGFQVETYGPWEFGQRSLIGIGAAMSEVSPLMRLMSPGFSRPR